MLDCGPLLRPICVSEPARLEEYGSQEVSRLTKAFEDGSKLAQLTCCRLHSSRQEGKSDCSNLLPPISTT